MLDQLQTGEYIFFTSADAFNQPLNDWDVVSVTLTDPCFKMQDFNKPLGNWNVENVSNMGYVCVKTFIKPT